MERHDCSGAWPGGRAAFLAACAGNAAPSNSAPSNAEPSAPAEAGVARWRTSLAKDVRAEAWRSGHPRGTAMARGDVAGRILAVDAGPFGRTLAENGLVVFLPYLAHPDLPGARVDPWTTDRDDRRELAACASATCAPSQPTTAVAGRVTWAGTSFSCRRRPRRRRSLDRLLGRPRRTQSPPAVRLRHADQLGQIDAMLEISRARRRDIWPESTRRYSSAFLDFVTRPCRLDAIPFLRSRSSSGPPTRRSRSQPPGPPRDRLRGRDTPRS